MVDVHFKVKHQSSSKLATQNNTVQAIYVKNRLVEDRIMADQYGCFIQFKRCKLATFKMTLSYAIFKDLGFTTIDDEITTYSQG